MARNVVEVMVADSQPILRLGLATAVNQAGDMRVVAEAGTLEDAKRLAERFRPDVLTMDVRMGQWCGGSLCHDI
ncbi:MAG: response regulator, partial [Chloroflexi bacterium]|nr:response regulator [Chloroflexota bacterium]